MENGKSWYGKWNHWLKNSITAKLAIIFLLFLMLKIPVNMIKELMEERALIHRMAVTDITLKWGGNQSIAGPILSIPILQSTQKKSGRKTSAAVKYCHFLPETLNADGYITGEIRRRNIHKTVVYKSTFNINGAFLFPDFKKLGIPEDRVLWKRAIISFGVSDMKGIRETVEITVNGRRLNFTPFVAVNDVVDSGMSAALPLTKLNNTSGKLDFSFNLALRGAGKIRIVPLGAYSKIRLSSNWNKAGFDGNFIPGEKTLDKSGFSAEWKLSHLNRPYPQQWIGNRYNIYDSELGVNLLRSVNNYQKTIRSIKYAVMFISLTFLTLFFFEILNKKRVHPFQYLLVGLTLCVFFALLLSMSEHIGFNFAYIISGIMTILLSSLYSISVFKSKHTAALLGSILLLLYGFVYTIIQLEDFALLCGSMGLFAILAAIMWLSRNIDWFSLSTNSEIQ